MPAGGQWASAALRAEPDRDTRQLVRALGSCATDLREAIRTSILATACTFEVPRCRSPRSTTTCRKSRPP